MRAHGTGRGADPSGGSTLLFPPASLLARSSCYSHTHPHLARIVAITTLEEMVRHYQHFPHHRHQCCLAFQSACPKRPVIRSECRPLPPNTAHRRQIERAAKLPTASFGQLALSSPLPALLDRDI